MELDLSLVLADPLPVVFGALMAISVFTYVVLDGFDLGVGILSRDVDDESRTLMISSIGPFWDANETWLVLAVGLLLVAFPAAHGIVLTELYGAVVVLLVGLTLRGVAFDFRAKVTRAKRPRWDRAFFIGSLLASLAQGWMLGRYVLGFQDGLWPLAFAALSAVCVAGAYSLIGAVWLVAKTEGELRQRSIDFAQRSLVLTAIGLSLVSITTPLVSERIRDTWFSFPDVVLLAPIPLMTIAALVALYLSLSGMKGHERRRWRWVPFTLTVLVFALAFFGLAWSFVPWIVPDQLTVFDAASARGSLAIILVGTCVTLPMIIGYSIFSYRVFRGPAKELAY